MFNCLCMDEEESSYNEFYDTRDVVARKNHRCCECGKAIEPGEKYEYAVGKNEDGLFSAKTCLLCAQIRDEMFSCGYSHGELWRTIHSEICHWDGLEEGDDEFFCICPSRSHAKRDSV